MNTKTTTDAPDSTGTFFESGPPELARIMAALGAADWLTDAVALALIDECNVAGSLRPRSVVETLRACDFVVEGNDGEYYIRDEERAYFRARLREDRELFEQTHRTLLRLAETEGVQKPPYLTWKLGLAYHTTPLDPARGLQLYRECYTGVLSGKQRLLGLLAEQQRQEGFIPAGEPLPDFLRGVTCFHEKEWAKARDYLEAYSAAREGAAQADYEPFDRITERILPLVRERIQRAAENSREGDGHEA
jgi:hypothetical protein